MDGDKQTTSLSLKLFHLMTIRLNVLHSMYVTHHYHHLSLNHEGCWGTTDDFTTSFLHFCLFSSALLDLANSRPVCSLMLSSHLFLCLPCLLPLFAVPCKMVLARPLFHSVTSIRSIHLPHSHFIPGEMHLCMEVDPFNTNI